MVTVTPVLDPSPSPAPGKSRAWSGGSRSLAPFRPADVTVAVGPGKGGSLTGPAPAWRRLPPPGRRGQASCVPEHLLSFHVGFGPDSES